jgi:hypothetical protein
MQKTPDHMTERLARVVARETLADQREEVFREGQRTARTLDQAKTERLRAQRLGQEAHDREQAVHAVVAKPTKTAKAKRFPEV